MRAEQVLRAWMEWVPAEQALAELALAEQTLLLAERVPMERALRQALAERLTRTLRVHGLEVPVETEAEVP